MYNDPKSTLAVLVCLANLVPVVAKLGEAVNALLGDAVATDESADGFFAQLAIQLDTIAPLLVCAAELEAAAHKLELRHPMLRALRDKRERLAASNVSRETSTARHGISHYEQDDEGVPDTERGSAGPDSSVQR